MDKLTKDMVMEGGHFIGMAGKFFLRRPDSTRHVLMLLLAGLYDSLEAGGQILNLFRQLAHVGGVLHVPLVKLLGVILLELGDQSHQVCSFVYTGLHVSVIP